jgi:acetyl-CoA decarbonylase/synthase complex subunit gamma
MLQVKKHSDIPLKIKGVRKISASSGSACCPADPESEDDKQPCCGPSAARGGGDISDKVPGFIAWLETVYGRVPSISTKLKFGDHLGACKARWAIGRMDYIIPPGLYAIGHPSSADLVLVTANYKMSYDIVRQSLSGRNVWLLVLETYGINVWCSAGKGTFGTGELVRRIKECGLAGIVNHRNLLLPILGAPGVAAHEVARQTGFKVNYAAIRAADLSEYFDNGMVTTTEMRTLTFTLYERLVLVPVELVMSLKSVTIIGVVVLLLIAMLCNIAAGFIALSAFLGACIFGIAVAPILLPWLPGRSFAAKGVVAGFIWCWIFFILIGGQSWSPLMIAAFFVALPAVSGFYSLNFTGCSTYTSRSGVKKEMRIALPSMAGAVAVSVFLLLAGRFLL